MLCLLAAVSCSRPEDFVQFRNSAGDGSRYDFEVPFTRPDAEYSTYVAFSAASALLRCDSIPARIVLVSPSGIMAAENVSFPLSGVRFAGSAVEFPYRSAVRVAQDTGMWHLSLILRDSSQYPEVLGAGFRYELK